MARNASTPRDLTLLDAIDAFKGEAIEESVWRVVREGRDPILGAPSQSRWCNNRFDVMYTAFEREGAVAEVFALLSSQPVFPSKIRFFTHRLSVRLAKVLRLQDFEQLARLGVDVARYREHRYERTQDIADAAYFLGFDGLIAPSARFKGSILVVFTDRLKEADALHLDTTDPLPIDWGQWKKSRKAE
ncbi:MAG: RES family NAD+ phosphorylase [Rhodospirillales bacterium]|nr:RES family NAD+ phosphorylase [Rhodospirillales bacterium]